MLTRIVSIAAKEFIHIRRDKRTLAVIFLIPIVQLILLGYTATTDIDHLRTAVLDMDRSRASRELITAYQTSKLLRHRRLRRGRGTSSPGTSTEATSAQGS